MSDRERARQLILRLANVHCQYVLPGRRPLLQRHIQLAVCICRRNQLASDELLSEAGFRP